MMHINMDHRVMMSSSSTTYCYSRGRSVSGSGSGCSPWWWSEYSMNDKNHFGRLDERLLLLCDNNGDMYSSGHHDDEIILSMIHDSNRKNKTTTELSLLQPRPASRRSSSEPMSISSISRQQPPPPSSSSSSSSPCHVSQQHYNDWTVRTRTECVPNAKTANNNNHHYGHHHHHHHHSSYHHHPPHNQQQMKFIMILFALLLYITSETLTVTLCQPPFFTMIDLHHDIQRWNDQQQQRLECQHNNHTSPSSSSSYSDPKTSSSSSSSGGSHRHHHHHHHHHPSHNNNVDAQMHLVVQNRFDMNQDHYSTSLLNNNHKQLTATTAITDKRRRKYHHPHRRRRRESMVVRGVQKNDNKVEKAAMVHGEKDKERSLQSNDGDNRIKYNNNNNNNDNRTRRMLNGNGNVSESIKILSTSSSAKISGSKSSLVKAKTNLMIKAPYEDAHVDYSNHDDDDDDHHQSSKINGQRSSSTLASTTTTTTTKQKQEFSLNPKNFDYENITAQVGHQAYMPCVIDSIGDKTVSWIRLKDFHLLTIGLMTYIQDDRFAVRYQGIGRYPYRANNNEWNLQIKHVNVKDEGLYECQINTDPPKSQYFYLHVVVPITEIVGNPNIFVRLGESINLTCLISQSPEHPAYVFWYHNDRMINYDYQKTAPKYNDHDGRGGGDDDDEDEDNHSDSNVDHHRPAGRITLQKSLEQNDQIISRLVINKATLDSSGNYTCSPSNAEPASTYVHVLQGEKRLSNDVQNDWNQAMEQEEKSATNEGHHSGNSGFRYHQHYRSNQMLNHNGLLCYYTVQIILLLFIWIT